MRPLEATADSPDAMPNIQTGHVSAQKNTGHQLRRLNDRDGLAIVELETLVAPCVVSFPGCCRAALRRCG